MTQRLDDFLSAKEGLAFSSQIHSLRAQLGIKPQAEMDATYGVDGSTLRAFHGWENPPSVLYRLWAEDIVQNLSPKELATAISSRSGFREWHRYLQESLKQHWLTYHYETPVFAHIMKLVDLFIKWLSAYNFSSSKFTKALERNANCALDRQTLGKMNTCYSNSLPLSDPRMGDVQCLEAYELCQDLIRRFSKKYGGTPLLFDYHAWRPGG